MRLVVLFAGAAVGLAACDGNTQTQENQSLEDSLTANSIVANDITAIDAVTADAANMAADVDINFTNDQVLYNGSGAAPSIAPPPGSTVPRKGPGKTAPPPVPQDSRPPREGIE